MNNNMRFMILSKVMETKGLTVLKVSSKKILFLDRMGNAHVVRKENGYFCIDDACFNTYGDLLKELERDYLDLDNEVPTPTPFKKTKLSK